MSAYPVPFTVERDGAQRLRLRNASDEPLHWVRVETSRRGIAWAPLTPRLDPGGWLDVSVQGPELARDTRVIVRWRRPNGDEYLYGVAL